MYKEPLTNLCANFNFFVMRKPLAASPLETVCKKSANADNCCTLNLASR